jgi:hypothetical protein
MKFIKLDLLTLLISLFLFASCENTSTIGLQLDPSNTIQGSLIDSATIFSRTQKEDPVSTIGANRYPIGFLKDPIFGTTEASIAMGVSLPYAAYTFGTSAVVDSAVLVLNFGGQFYGDSTSTYSFDVHQLNTNLTQQTSFLSSKDYPYYSTLLGSKTGKLYPTTSYKVTDVVAGKADTLRTVTPQIRIRIDKAFIQSKIAGASTSELLNQTNFERAFNGFHVQLNKTNSTGNGGIAFVEFANSRSELAIYYKKQNATTASLIDTVNISFPISSTAVPVAATVKHDYATTDVATQLSTPTTQYPVTYLQPLAGLKNKISFPYLSKLADNLGKVVVNKAELVIDMRSGSDVIPYGPAPRLSLYRYDIAERRQNLPDNNPSTQYAQGDPRAVSPAVFGGYYNSVTRQYIFTVTSYIQDLLDKKTVDYGTFLAPTPLTEFEVYQSVGTAARTVIGSFKKSPSAGDNIIKLNIYYTKIN